MDSLLRSYERLFKELEKLETEKHPCNESAHILQDKIYRKFIRDTANNKIKNAKDIRTISKLIVKRVIKYDKDRWYA